MTLVNAPTARYAHTAVMAGGEMIVWGGDDIFTKSFASGGRYCAIPGAVAGLGLTVVPSAGARRRGGAGT